MGLWITVDGASKDLLYYLVVTLNCVKASVRVSQKDCFTPPDSPFISILSHRGGWLVFAALLGVTAVLWGGKPVGARPDKLPVTLGGEYLGEIELTPLSLDGQLHLGFTGGEADVVTRYRLEWWQLAEREDRPGYPRIDPQSGGSGLPGAKGEDEDPAYYSAEDYSNPELGSRIFSDGRYVLLDRPTHDSGFRLESWLVQRLDGKHVRRLAGVQWGITVIDGALAELHHPRPMVRRSRFDWEESLRISGFGVGWTIEDEPGRKLP